MAHILSTLDCICIINQFHSCLTCMRDRFSFILFCMIISYETKNFLFIGLFKCPTLRQKSVVEYVSFFSFKSDSFHDFTYNDKIFPMSDVL